LVSLWKSIPQQFSHLERVSHGHENSPLQSMGLEICLFNPTGLNTCFFSPTLKSTRYRYNKQQISVKVLAEAAYR